MRRSHFLFSIVLFGILLLVPYNARPAILRVCHSGCEYSTIQSAIDAATKNGDTVQVERGSYRENIVFPDLQITISSVDGSQFTWIQGISSSGYTVSYSPGKSYRVLVGFRIAGGTKGGMLIKGNGGIVDCEVLNNVGAGIEIVGGPMSIFNTTIQRNRRASGGGGIQIRNASVYVYSSTIKRNSDSAMAGGIYGQKAKLYMVSSTLQENGVQENLDFIIGGGIHLLRSEAYIFNSKIIDNQCNSKVGVGGMLIYDSRVKVLKSIIIGNSGGKVGGISSNGKSKLTMTNCTVADNVGREIPGSLSQSVGGIKIFSQEGYDSVFSNCTVIKNVSERANDYSVGGIDHEGSGSLSVVNSIIAWNTSYNPDHRDLVVRGSGLKTVQYSCLGFYSGLTPWPTITKIYDCKLPMTGSNFVSPGDYHLRPGSTLIDAGTSEKTKFPMIPDIDIDGDRRPQGARHDLGSDEFIPTN